MSARQNLQSRSKPSPIAAYGLPTDQKVQPAFESYVPEKQLTKLGEQSVRVLEILRVKAFCKATISGTKDIKGFGTLALLDPEPSQVGGCAKLKRSCLLVACRSQGLLEKRLGLDVRCCTHEQSECS